MSKCRAKNPGSCRVHGSSNSAAVIVNDQVAMRNVKQSNKAVQEASNMEEYFEANQNLHHDRKAYDATMKGLNSLKDDIADYGNKLTDDERMQKKIRLQDAMDYREEVLSKDPAHQETQSNYENFVKENAVARHVLSKENFGASLEKLKEVPFGTPIAVKLESGTLYTFAGDGYYERPKNKLRAKMRNASFVSPYDSSFRGASLSFEGSIMRIPARKIKEVAILKEGAYNKGFDSLKNSHVSDEVTAVHPSHEENSRWSVKGENYYLEIEASKKNTDKASDASWESANFPVFDPQKPATEIREIKS